MMGIESFPYKKQENTGDMYYTLTFKEHKDLNTPATGDDKPVDETTGLKDRPSVAQKPKTATLFSKGSDVLDAAKRHMEIIVIMNALFNQMT